jgi:hypothetical protein
MFLEPGQVISMWLTLSNHLSTSRPQKPHEGVHQ